MIVMDLEWNSGVGDGKSLAEILQIGAVKYDRSAHKIVDTFSVFIHPCVHSEFSVGAKALPQLWRSLESRLTFEQAYCQESHSLQIVQSHGLHIEPNPAWGHCPGDSTF